MAHFAYIAGRGSLANWGIGTTVSPAEFWWFESSIFKCVNGDDGGTWAPAAVITIGGTAGVHITAPFQVAGILCDGGLAAYGDCAFGTVGSTSVTSYADFIADASLTCNGTMTVSGNIAANANLTCQQMLTSVGTIQGNGSLVLGGSGSANSLSIEGALTTLGGATIGNAAGDTITLNGTVTANAAVTINGAATLGAGATLNGTFTCNGRLRAANSGRYSHNYAEDSLSGNVTYSVDGGARTYMGYTALNFTDLGGAARDLRLYTDGAVSGDQLEVKNSTTGTAYNLVVRDSGGGSLTIIGQGETYRFMFTGSDWIAWSN